MSKRISDATRRDIFDALAALDLWGRLDEVDFLARIYDLDGLPSNDTRFDNARRDIIQHRYLDGDWDEDWIFWDDRFGLKDGSDATLLRFLAELLHPEVRPDPSQVHQLADALNQLLALDGYVLEPISRISGRPVFGGLPREPVTQSGQARPKHFTEDVLPLVSTISRLAEIDGSDLEREILLSAHPRLEGPEYDNLDGARLYYTLTLVVPVGVFARLGDGAQAVEWRIADRARGIQRGPDNHRVTAVAIRPSLEETSAQQLAKIVAARSQRPIPLFWAPDHFRLFVSHGAAFHQRARALCRSLLRYYISGYVAHEALEPGGPWQQEVEAALRSMHAMAALITPDASVGDWADQQIGWALGSGAYVLPVRRGWDARGFLAKTEGIEGAGKSVDEVAEEIFKALLREPATTNALLEALVAGFERSGSYRAARDNLRLLEKAPTIPSELLRRVEVAIRTNERIADSTGVPGRVEKLLERANRRR